MFVVLLVPLKPGRKNGILFCPWRLLRIESELSSRAPPAAAPSAMLVRMGVRVEGRGTMANAPGWQPDPEHGDQERYWSGSAWTERVRLTGRGGSSRVPEHGPQLHRALAAATTDIDAVEDRLSTLFERSDGDPKPASSPPPAARPGEPVADDDEILRHSVHDESDAAFAELDAALASEEPDEPDPAWRMLFRRRA
jgi:hypothetical protein